MAKRTITDDEIALIKAMYARGMKNKDIQFFFNRPDRAVNSGRITGIRDESYGPSKDIEPVSDTELDVFLASNIEATEVAGVAVPGLTEQTMADPLSDSAIKKLFSRGKDKVWRLDAGETDAQECKTSFGMKHAQAWLRAIAALANNSGGYIFFGVNDKGVKGPKEEDLSHAVVGMSNEEFQKVDPAAVAKRVKAVFDPTPRFRTTTATIGGKVVGVIYVEQHESRPVIATKQEGDKISEGDIFFRYSGQSTRIKYSDLRAMLDARDREARAQILPMVERLLQLGPERAMIADLVEGTLKDGRRAIQIDQALTEKLNFIKEGEFSEVAGAPTLRLVGEVQPVGARVTVKMKLGLLSRDHLLNAFLNQVPPDDPLLHIRFAVEHAQGEWLPIHYFAKLAGLSRQQLIEFIKSTNGTDYQKNLYSQRAQGNAAFHKAQGRPKLLLAELVAGNRPVVTNAQEASHAGQAIQALPDGFAIDLPPTLDLLKTCLPLVKRTALSIVRRGMCRVDELAFGEAASLSNG
jgi:hypothetical protein